MKLFSKRSFGLTVAVMLVAAMVVPAIASAATTLKLGGSTTVYPGAVLLGQQYKSRTHVNVIVTGGGSGTGISQVLGGSINIGMSSRDLKDSEKAAGAVGTVLARDAVAVIVNRKNPVTNLTEAQIRNIYLGRTTNWKQVGGPNARIILAGRTAASGTYEFFKEKFLLGSRQARLTKQYSSNGMVRSAVYSNRYTIGYVSMAYLNTSIKGLKVGGVYPNRTNASRGTYKYVRPLYWVTKGAPTGASRAFINWTRSSVGQSYVAREFLPYK